MPSAQATPSQRTPGVGNWRKRRKHKSAACAGQRAPGGPRRPRVPLCRGRIRPRASGGPRGDSVFGGINVFASATAFPSASQKNQPNTPDKCARTVTARILMITKTRRQPNHPSTGRGLNKGRNSTNRGHVAAHAVQEFGVT